MPHYVVKQGRVGITVVKVADRQAAELLARKSRGGRAVEAADRDEAIKKAGDR